MYPILFELGGQSISSWNVLALTGIWAAYFSLSRQFQRKAIHSIQVKLFFLGAVVVWFLGAALGHIYTVDKSQKMMDPSGTHWVGLVLYGGVILTLLYSVCIWAFSRWRRKIGLGEFFDWMSVALLWALGFARIGCALYGCCYGTPAGSWPGYVLSFEHWDRRSSGFPMHLLGVKLHPAPLYEAFGIFSILFLLSQFRARQLASGVAGLLCWITYGVLRFCVEWIRMDFRGTGLFGFSPSQCIAAASCCIAIPILIWKQKAIFRTESLLN